MGILSPGSHPVALPLVSLANGENIKVFESMAKSLNSIDQNNWSAKKNNNNNSRIVDLPKKEVSTIRHSILFYPSTSMYWGSIFFRSSCTIKLRYLIEVKLYLGSYARFLKLKRQNAIWPWYGVKVLVSCQDMEGIFFVNTSTKVSQLTHLPVNLLVGYIALPLYSIPGSNQQNLRCGLYWSQVFL